MNPHTQIAYYALWIAHPALQLGVAAAMLKRKLHRKFPVFFCYLLAQVAIFAVLFPTYLSGSYERYFYAYWISAGISLALGFKVIHEIFLDVFRPYHTLKDLGSVLFQWAGLVMLMAAAVVAAASPSSSQVPIVQAVLTMQRCVRVIQCGLVLFLLVFSRYLGVSWKQHSFGIALGFGGFAGVELILVAVHSVTRADETTAALINMVAYNCAILLWLGYAWFKGVARDSSATLLMSQRWDQSLSDLQHPAPPDSLIPIFENMVERAFSRSHDDHTGEETSVSKPPDTEPPASFIERYISKP